MDEALQNADDYSGMLEVALLLAEWDAERELTPAENAVRLVLRIDNEVCNGGWLQWLDNMSITDIDDSLAALGETGCREVLSLARRALAVARLDPGQDSDSSKARKLLGLSKPEVAELSALDMLFYGPPEDYMARCRDFIRTHRAEFGV